MGMKPMCWLSSRDYDHPRSWWRALVHYGRNPGHADQCETFARLSHKESALDRAFAPQIYADGRLWLARSKQLPAARGFLPS
jgi:hypothetical protein